MESVDLSKLFSEIEKTWTVDAEQSEAIEAIGKRVQAAIIPKALAVCAYYLILKAVMPESMAAELSKAFAHDMLGLHE